MTPETKKYKNEGLEIPSISNKSKNDPLLTMSDPDINAKNLNVNQEKILHGKALQIYWYILTHKRAGLREIQKALKISSTGTVSYQINKLLKAGIILKKEKDGKYYVKEGVKKGMFGFFFRLGPFMIPRFSLYLIINILGVVGYVYLASIYGDKFITNPASLLFLFFIIFCTSVFIYESIKIWERKPT